MSQLVKLDQDYASWIQNLSARYKQSQIKAATHVNSEMLKFYWSLGKDIVTLQAESRWGSKFIKNLSADLRDALPGVKGLSVTSIDYAKRFYLLYNEYLIIHPQVVGELTENPIWNIPWGHHRYIIDKCLSWPEKAMFFVRKTIENGWSRNMLLNFLDTDLYERQGKAITNFKLSLPAPQSDFAQEMTKDPYNFDSLAISEDYREKELEDALEDNIRKFLLELGTGFAYVGREYRIVIGQTEKFIDMLFYNLNLRCYVVIEIKVQDYAEDTDDHPKYKYLLHIMGVTFYIQFKMKNIYEDEDGNIIKLSLDTPTFYEMRNYKELSAICNECNASHNYWKCYTDAITYSTFSSTNFHLEYNNTYNTTYYKKDKLEQFAEYLNIVLDEGYDAVRFIIEKSLTIGKSDKLTERGFTKQEFVQKLKLIGTSINKNSSTHVKEQILPEKHITIHTILNHIDSNIGDIDSVQIIHGDKIGFITAKDAKDLDINDSIRSLPDKEKLDSLIMIIHCSYQDVSVYFKRLSCSSDNSLFFNVTATRSGDETTKLDILPRDMGMITTLEVRLGPVEEEYQEAKNYVDTIVQKYSKTDFEDMTQEELIVLDCQKFDLEISMYWAMKYFNHNCFFQALIHFKIIFDNLLKRPSFGKEETNLLYNIATYIGLIYLHLNQPDRAFYYLYIAKDSTDQSNLSNYILVQCALKTPGLTEYLEGLYRLYEKSTDKVDKTLFAFLRKKLIQMYIQARRIDKAESFIDEILRNSKDPQDIFRYTNYKDYINKLRGAEKDLLSK